MELKTPPRVISRYKLQATVSAPFKICKIQATSIGGNMPCLSPLARMTCSGEDGQCDIDFMNIANIGESDSFY